MPGDDSKPNQDPQSQLEVEKHRPDEGPPDVRPGLDTCLGCMVVLAGVAVINVLILLSQRTWWK